MHCAECKGKGLCGLEKCPILSRFYAKAPFSFKKEYHGNSPSVFIGSYGYPDVVTGPLLIDDNDHPPDWINGQYSIEDIVAVRSRTIRGRSKEIGHITELQEIALSSKPLPVDVDFTKPISFRLTFDGIMAPVGLSGELKDLQVLENAHVARAVDKVTSDTDLKAVEALDYLYGSGIDTYKMTSLLSSGLLGKRRRVTPTRWAITAVDDMISKKLAVSIRKNSSTDTISIFSHELYGNLIIFILIPGEWKFEMIEIWSRNALWNGENDFIVADRERGIKKNYSPITGAYYSARLAVTEYLSPRHISGTVIVIRRISSEYWAPLGTWVIREVSRLAMKKMPVTCENVKQAEEIVSSILGYDDWRIHSQYLSDLTRQKKITDFIGF